MTLQTQFLRALAVLLMVSSIGVAVAFADSVKTCYTPLHYESR